MGARVGPQRPSVAAALLHPLLSFLRSKCTRTIRSKGGEAEKRTLHPPGPSLSPSHSHKHARTRRPRAAVYEKQLLMTRVMSCRAYGM